MRTKISKVAKDLNVGVNTAVEFLRKHNIEVDEGNPNARIDSDAVDLLMREFSNDKTAKAAAEGFSKRREHKKEKTERTPSAASAPAAKTGPVILGKIDLDNLKSGMKAATEHAVEKNNASAQESEPVRKEETVVKDDAPKPEAAPEPEVAANQASVSAKAPEPVAQKAEAVATSKSGIAPQSGQEVKAAPAPEPAPVPEPEPEAGKPAHAPVRESGDAAPAKDPETVKETAPATAPAQETAAKSADAEENKPFRLAGATPGPELKVLGKIDLSAINQSTRPKKKGKNERRAENADRKKRKRIGKEKVDIDKAANSPDSALTHARNPATDRTVRAVPDRVADRLAATVTATAAGATAVRQNRRSAAKTYRSRSRKLSPA